MKYKTLIYKIMESYPYIYLYDPTNYFCTTEVCNGYIDKYGYLYKDSNHLGNNKSIFWANNFFNSFDFFAKQVFINKIRD